MTRRPQTEADKNRQWKRSVKRQVSRDLRKRDREHLAALRARLRELKARKRLTQRALRERCRGLRRKVRDLRRAELVRIRAAIEQLRKRRLDVNRRAKKLREQIRLLCARRLSRTSDEFSRAAAALQDTLREARALARQMATLDAPRRPRRSAIEALQESDDAVERNLPPELVQIWRANKRHISGGSGKSRTEAFLQWVDENPTEIYAADERRAAEWLEAELKKQEAVWQEEQARLSRRPPPKTKGARGSKVAGSKATGSKGSKAAFLKLGLVGLGVPTEGLRPESFEFLAAGGKAPLPPLISVWPDGSRTITDGRHRITLARRRRDKTIKVHARGFGPRGAEIWSYRGPVQLGGEVEWNPHAEDLRVQRAPASEPKPAAQEHPAYARMLELARGHVGGFLTDLTTHDRQTLTGADPSRWFAWMMHKGGTVHMWADKHISRTATKIKRLTDDLEAPRWFLWNGSTLREMPDYDLIELLLNKDYEARRSARDADVPF